MFPILILAALAVAVLSQKKPASGSGSGTTYPPDLGPPVRPAPAGVPVPPSPPSPPSPPGAAAQGCETAVSDLPEPLRSQALSLWAQASGPVPPEAVGPLSSALEAAALGADMGYPKAAACLRDAARKVRDGKKLGFSDYSPRAVEPLTIGPQTLSVQAKP